MYLNIWVAFYSKNIASNFSKQKLTKNTGMTDQEEKDPHQFFTKARRDKTRQKPINKTKIKQSIHYSIQQNISINI